VVSEPRYAETLVDTLASRRLVTVILRLVVDQRGRLIYGEVVDESASSRGHFSGWRGLTRTVRQSLIRAEAGPDLG
jgi:hypothetical protein